MNDTNSFRKFLNALLTKKGILTIGKINETWVAILLWKFLQKVRNKSGNNPERSGIFVSGFPKIPVFDKCRSRYFEIVLLRYNHWLAQLLFSIKNKTGEICVYEYEYTSCLRLPWHPFSAWRSCHKVEMSCNESFSFHHVRSFLRKIIPMVIWWKPHLF